MSLIYVTGPSGTGKSTLGRLLREEGFETYDEDDPQTGTAHNLQTGKTVPIPSVDKRDADWFTRHEWRMLDSAKRRLQEAAATRQIILFGNTIKPEGQAIFSKVIYLKVDDKTLQGRILGRKDNDYGKSEAEMKGILTRKKAMDSAYNESNAIVIDATKPLQAVDDQIKDIVLQNL
jgi:thymidylate kinase